MSLAAFAAPSKAEAEAAPCAQWAVPDRWRIRQSGDLVFSLSTPGGGGDFHGTAEYVDTERSELKSFIGGDVAGSIDGDRFTMDIYWKGSDNADGVYEGRIQPDGRLAGTTYDRAHSNNRGTWYASQPLVCAAELSDPRDRPVEPPSQRPSQDYTQSVQTPDLSRPRPNTVIQAPDIARPRRNPAIQTPDMAAPRPAPSAPYSNTVERPGMASAQAAPATCLSGYVWRVAVADDLVCVTPESRTLAAGENRAAAQRRAQNGAYGPNTCLSGYVWRLTNPADLVCVTPERRQAVADENSLSASRRVGG